jgi:hypothetical protein
MVECEIMNISRRHADINTLFGSSSVSNAWLHGFCSISLAVTSYLRVSEWSNHWPCVSS